MIRKRFAFIFLIVFIFSIAGFIFISFYIKDDTVANRTHPLVFFESKSFYEGIAQADEYDQSFVSPISGGIIPHDLFPRFITADFFHRLAKQRPKTIILLGPNHYERGEYPVLSSLYGWETPFGVVQPNTQLINILRDTDVLHIDEQVLPNDHSVAGSMPYIAYYLPETTVIPILVSGFMTEHESKLLADALISHLSHDTIIVAAVDFSHYLTNKQAQEKDKVTLDLLKNLRYKRLFFLNNDYVDSPPSLAVLLMTMQSLHANHVSLLHHTNSGELQRKDFIETTSYISLVYF